MPNGCAIVAQPGNCHTHIMPNEVVVTVTHETPQERFNRIYISSAEICRTLNVTRPTVLQARRRGLLPNPIMIPGCTLFVWERANIQPYLDAWRIMLSVRSNHPSAAAKAIA